MRVIILTESSSGTAAHHLPYIFASKEIEVVMVVRSLGKKLKKSKFLFKKIKKAFSIGPLGVWNGIRMRKWFGEDVENKLQLRNLRDLCSEFGIPYNEVDITNSQKTIDLFRSSGADIGVSLGNSFISKRVFEIPQYGMINIHHEILPQYQNAQSIIWQIYNNSKYTGYTIHEITSKIDGGAILKLEKVPIVFKTTLPSTISETCVALLKASAKGLVYLLKNYKELKDKAMVQTVSTHYTTPTWSQFRRIVRNHDRMSKNGHAAT